MWKEYYVFIILFPCLNYVLCNTSSDDGPYRSPFKIELLQILKQISTRLHVISENTDRNWTLQFNAEMDNLKQENKNLRNDLETVLIETALEKKRSLERDAEMDNLKQDNSKLKTDLETVYNETAIEKKRSLERDAEMDNLKQDNSKLKTDLETVYNETAIEKKRSLERDAEMDNLKQDNKKLRNDLEKVLNETAMEKMRSQEMDKILMEKFKELRNLTSNLQKGSIAENNQFRMNQEKVNKNVSNHLQNLDGKTDKHEIFTNNSYRDIKLDVDSLNASLIRGLIDVKRRLDPKDCGDLIDSDLSLQNGVYKIYPHILEEVNVYCDMNDGGWTVFQRRMNGNTGFYRGWNEYRDGFGDPADEYWLGNKYLHHLTRSRDCTLKVDLTNIDSITGYATYTNFKIESEADNYRLRIGNYSGNAGHDSLRAHNNREFTTKDRDHNPLSGVNCAVDNKGAWWYRNCASSSLNGEYGGRGNKGVWWWGYPSSRYMKATTMKIKCT